MTPRCKQPALVVLGAAKDLEAGPLLAFRDDVGQTRGVEAGKSRRRPGRPPKHPIWRGLFGVLEAARAGAGRTKRVYVSPDGVLNTIPIGLMADSNGKLLMEKYELRTVNSTKDLLLSPHVAPAEERVARWQSEIRFDGGAAEDGARAVARGRGWVQAPACSKLRWRRIRQRQTSNASATQSTRAGEI